MKIFILSNLFPLPWEPNRASFNRQQFESLAQDCDVKVTVVVSFLDLLRNPGKANKHNRNRIEIDYLWYFYIPRFARFTYAITLFVTLLFKVRQIRRFAPDCMLLSWAYPDAVAGTLIARLLKIPTVIKVHGSDINMHAQKPLRAAQILWSMRKAKAVLSVSRDLAEKMEKIGVEKDKIHVIYNGVDKTRFYPAARSESRKVLQIAEEKEIVLFLGNLKREKGCIDLLAAFATLASTRNSAELYYIGSGPAADFIRTEANRLGLSERVHLIGPVEHDRLATWINSSNLVALPSYNEGVPNVLLESMACGIPVVATRVGGIPEIVPDAAGILCEPRDKSALIKALDECLARKWNSHEILDSVVNISWEKNRREVLDLLISASRDPQHTK